MKVGHLDIYAVSDSTRKMRSAGDGKSRNIFKELEQRNKHCTVDAESGATRRDLIEAIIEAGDTMMKKNNGGPPLAQCFTLRGTSMKSSRMTRSFSGTTTETHKWA
jgi:uncharacterized glyoxalase superfamily metalloenzyme YdcJ